MGGKQPQASVLAKPHHGLPAPTGFFAPSLVTVISLPLGFLFALGFQGNTLTYAVTVVSFGLLTALDLKTGFLRSILGFAATLLTLSYILQNSAFSSQISPSGGFSFLFVALPLKSSVVGAVILNTTRNFHDVIAVGCGACDKSRPYTRAICAISAASPLRLPSLVIRV